MIEVVNVTFEGENEQHIRSIRERVLSTSRLSPRKLNSMDSIMWQCIH